MVDANVIIGKHYLSPGLVKVCEEGKVEFVEPLLKYGATVYESKTLMQVLKLCKMCLPDYIMSKASHLL